MKIKFLMILNLFYYSLSMKASQYKEKEIACICNHINIYGILLEPINETSTVALIIAGSGPTDRDGNQPNLKNNCLKFLAEGLVEEGIATFRYDKRSIGKSKIDMEEKDLRFEHFIDDAQYLISWLKKEMKFSKVIVIGHSEGSLIGMIAAHRASADAFISIAGAAYSVDKIIIEQTKTMPEEVINIIKYALDSLKNGIIVKNISPEISTLFRISLQPYLISWMRYDPINEIRKLHIPILIVHGTNDIQVSINNAIELSKANSYCKLEIIAHMNHIMKYSENDEYSNISTYMNPDLPISKDLITVLVNFIKGI